MNNDDLSKILYQEREECVYNGAVFGRFQGKRILQENLMHFLDQQLLKRSYDQFHQSSYKEEGLCFERSTVFSYFQDTLEKDLCMKVMLFSALFVNV